MAESGVGLGDVIRDSLAAQEFWFELAESGGQRSEVRGQKSEVRSQRVPAIVKSKASSSLPIPDSSLLIQA